MFSVDVGRLLSALGVRARRTGRRWVAPCPFHDDKDPSWRIVDDPGSPRHGSHHCFSCGAGGGPWELTAHVLGLTLEDAGRWVTQEVLGIRPTEERDVPKVVISDPSRRVVGMEMPWGVRIPSLDGSEWFGPALDYLHDRRVPDWQIERWHVGYATRGRCAMRVVVPVVTRGALLSYVGRLFVRDDRLPRYDAARRTDLGADPERAMFGEPAFEQLDAERRRGVGTVTEGVFKMLAMERAGAPNPMAILGASNMSAEKIAMLATFRRLIVATDPDPAGEKAYQEIDAMVGRWVEVVRATMDRAPDDASDEENMQVIDAAL